MKRITAFQFNVVFVHSNYNFRCIFAFLSFSASMRTVKTKHQLQAACRITLFNS